MGCGMPGGRCGPAGCIFMSSMGSSGSRSLSSLLVYAICQQNGSR